jgi:outer membrane protein OmpA-like peptidoglycan-associated protein
MSLLLCFFIMLFALSVIQEVKWEAIVETMNAKMGYSGQSKVESRGNKSSMAMSTISELGRRNAALTGGQMIPGKGESPGIQTISMTGAPVKGGLIRFELGSEVLTQQAKKDLDALLPQLLASPHKIMIQGHAAPDEAELGIYHRDIDLAHDRAVNVMKFLMSSGLKEEFFHLNIPDSTTIPNRAILPRGTDPKLAGASVAVYLLDSAMRPRESKAKD